MSAPLTAEERSLHQFAEELAFAAKMLGEDHGADLPTAAMALSFAATKIIFRNAASGDIALQAVKIMNETALKAVADMIAGADADHQVTQ